MHTAPRPSTAPDLAWKPNWAECRERFDGFWARRGLLIGMWGRPDASTPQPLVSAPGPGTDPAQRHLDTAWRTASAHNYLARGTYPGDILPLADHNLGPGSLALCLGCEPSFQETVWFHPCAASLAELPTLRFDPDNRWFRLQAEQLQRQVELAAGRYLVGIPDLVEGVDILSALVGPQQLMLEMSEDPDLVWAKVQEVEIAYREVYDQLRAICAEPDGGTAFAAFLVWARGRAAKVQCDACGMFSPKLFNRLVVPALTAQCDWLDHALFHLDGTQAIKHLDALLAIPSLDAIEWTPQSGFEEGGHPRWFDLYRRIKAGGKGVQAVGVKAEQVVPLLDAIGPEGTYIILEWSDEAGFERVWRATEQYRR